MSTIEQFVDAQGRQWVVVPAPAYVDGKGGRALADVSHRLLEKGVAHIVLDFGGTRVVNSVGIARLIEIVEAFRERDGAVALCTSNPLIVKTFRMMGLAQKATLWGCVQEAIRSITQSGGGAADE